jgi:branched-chain amino acid aminotransferase
MGATVSVNGRITSERGAVISVFDHGFLYGEGIYETMRSYNRRPFLFDRHVRRLRNSARMIALPLLFTDDRLASQIRETMAAADLNGAEAYIRVLVTCGIGELTYDPAATPVPSIVIIVKPQEDPSREEYDRGVRVVIVDIVRNHPDTVNPMIKSNNLLNCALAAQEAIRRGGYEGVMRNYRGRSRSARHRICSSSRTARRSRRRSRRGCCPASPGSSCSTWAPRPGSRSASKCCATGTSSRQTRRS